MVQMVGSPYNPSPSWVTWIGFPHLVKLFQKGPQGIVLSCHVDVLCQEFFDSIPISALLVDILPLVPISMILGAAVGGLH